MSPMLWVILALAGAFFTATHYALIKRYEEHVSYLLLMTGAFLVNSFILFSIVLFHGLPTIQPGFWNAVAATTVLNIVASFLYYRALKVVDFSLAQPLLSLTPAFLVISSDLILHEHASIMGICGVLLIVVGVYIMNLNAAALRQLRFWQPFQVMFNNQPLFSIFVVSVLFGISSSYDKITVVTSDAYLSSAVVYGLLGTFFLFFMLVCERNAKMIQQVRTNWLAFGLGGLTLALVSATVNYALTLQLATYVLAVKRLSILFSLLYAKKLFAEKQLLQRTIASLVMIGGTLLIIFAK